MYRPNCAYRKLLPNTIYFEIRVWRRILACWRTCPGSIGAIKCWIEEGVGIWSTNGKGTLGQKQDKQKNKSTYKRNKCFFSGKKKRVNCSTITVLQTLFIRKLRILLLKEPQKVQRYVISNLSAPLMQKYCV